MRRTSSTHMISSAGLAARPVAQDRVRRRVSGRWCRRAPQRRPDTWSCRNSRRRGMDHSSMCPAVSAPMQRLLGEAHHDLVDGAFVCGRRRIVPRPPNRCRSRRCRKPVRGSQYSCARLRRLAQLLPVEWARSAPVDLQHPVRHIGNRRLQHVLGLLRHVLDAVLD